MLNDEQIFELQELLKQVSISSGVVGFDKVHIDDELTISDNGKWDDSGIHITNLTKIKDNAETPQQLFPLSVANAGKVLAVGEDGDGLIAVEKQNQLYEHVICISNNETVVGLLTLVSTLKDETTINNLLESFILFGGYFASESNDDGRVVFLSQDLIVYYDSGMQSITSVSFDEYEYAETPTRL